METIEKMLGSIKNSELKTKLRNLYEDTQLKMMEMPASTKHHHAYVGGYNDHVQQIMHNGIQIYKMMAEVAVLDFELDDIILLTFVHDLDKLERYVLDGEYKKGSKEGQPKFAYRHDWKIDPYAKVCTMLAKYGIALTDEQIHALVFQAGGWSEFIGDHTDMSKLATVLHAADMLSAKCTPTREDLKAEEDL